jgi:hypothetical protein
LHPQGPHDLIPHVCALPLSQGGGEHNPGQNTCETACGRGNSCAPRRQWRSQFRLVCGRERRPLAKTQAPDFPLLVSEIGGRSSPIERHWHTIVGFLFLSFAPFLQRFSPFLLSQVVGLKYAFGETRMYQDKRHFLSPCYLSTIVISVLPLIFENHDLSSIYHLRKKLLYTFS